MSNKENKKKAKKNNARPLAKAKNQRRAKNTSREANNSGNLTYNSELLINSWHARDYLYQQLFGEHKHISPPNYAPPPRKGNAEKISGRAIEFNLDNNNQSLDLSEQQLAIFVYAPDPLRPYWTYLTAGLSTPWLQDEPQEVSGFGLELMIKSPLEAEWPAQILRTMAYYIFNHMGTLSPGKRLTLNASIIAGGESLLRNVLIWYPDEAPDCWYQLPSGGFGIFTAIGITDDEMRLTESIHEEYGTWCMLQILTRLGIGQVTDPARASVMDRKDIASVIDSVQTYAQQFHQAFPMANQLRGRQIEIEEN